MRAIPPPTPQVRFLSITMAPAMAVIMGIDLRLRGAEELLVHGLVDEVAHLLTALIVLSAFRAVGMPVHWLAVAIGAVAIDIEYLLIRADVLAPVVEDSYRGVAHTLGPALAVILVGLAIPPLRIVLVSLGLAMLTHVVRDTATSESALFWPLSDQVMHLRYSGYLAIMAAFTVVTTGVVALTRDPKPAPERSGLSGDTPGVVSRPRRAGRSLESPQ